MATSQWTAAKISGTSNTPLLLINFGLTKDGYSFYLTDLASIWSEKLSRKQIIRRSLDENTSIDPTESTQQYSKLLEKIDDGLRGKEGSSLHLYQADEQSYALKLLLINKLTSPLSPLVWPLHLQALGQGWLREILILPIISKSTMYSEQIKQLHGTIEEKDQVISRLCDRLQASGVDLASVFPNTSGLKIPRRADVRSHLAPYVKGLAKSGKGEWSMTPKSVDNTSKSFVDRLPPVLSALSERDIDGEHMENSSILDWTAHLNLLDTKQLNEVMTGEVKKFETPNQNTTGFSAVDVSSYPCVEEIRRDNEDSAPYRCKTEEESGAPIKLVGKTKAPATRKLGVIGGKCYGSYIPSLSTGTFEERNERDAECNAPVGEMSDMPSTGLEGGRMAEEAQNFSLDDTNKILVDTANLMSSKVHNRIGGMSKEKATQVLEDASKSSAESSSAKHRQIVKKQINSLVGQDSESTTAPPDILAQEKADHNRERLRLEAKGQHSVPIRKKRRF